MKLGDTVRIIRCKSMPGCSCGGKYDGKVATIEQLSGNLVPRSGLSIDTPRHWWEEDELQVINDKEITMNKKYYRLLKDDRLLDEGAIVENIDSEHYKPVDDVWVKDFMADVPTWSLIKESVENNPEWFERVYPIGKLEKMAFGTKRQAQAAAAALYKGGK